MMKVIDGTPAEISKYLRERKIKEGCGKEFVLEGIDVECGDEAEYKDECKVILCLEC